MGRGSSTCNEAAGLCEHAHKGWVGGCGGFPAWLPCHLSPRPGHSEPLAAAASLPHSQSIPVSRPSCLPLAQDRSARSAVCMGARAKRAGRAVR